MQSKAVGSLPFCIAGYTITFWELRSCNLACNVVTSALVVASFHSKVPTKASVPLVSSITIGIDAPKRAKEGQATCPWLLRKRSLPLQLFVFQADDYHALCILMNVMIITWISIDEKLSLLIHQHCLYPQTFPQTALQTFLTVKITEVYEPSTHN